MIINKKLYLDHIKDDNQIITMRNILDKVERVLKYHDDEYTDFLDPYQRNLCYSFLNRFPSITYFEEGGFTESERKIIIMHQSYKDRIEVDNPIKAICISFKSYNDKIRHRDILGSILGLGIKREKIGDILIHEKYSQVVLLKDTFDYVRYNLKTVNKCNVIVNEIGLDELKLAREDYIDIFIVVSSLRLDAIISSVLHCSRSKSSNIIKGEKVKVNWKPVIQNSFELKEGDIFSVRGTGRFKLVNIVGNTKKGRFKIMIRKFI